jgi:hypothetical protein
MKRIIVVLLALTASAGLFAQSDEADFQTSANSDGSLTITKYVGWDGGDITIPALIGGKPVTAIGEQAFVGSDVTSVVIPEGVTSIGDRAFSDQRLTSVAIPDSVTSIGDGAFSGNQLTSVTIGKGVTSIGDGAFYGNQLTSVTLAANIAADLLGAFGDNIFYNYIANDRKAGTYVANMKIEQKTADDFRYIETQYGLVVIGYDQSAKTALRIPDQINGVAVKAIDGTYNEYEWTGAFRGKGVSRLLIPEGVTFIGSWAFADNQLTSVVIPEGVTFIEGWAFTNNQLTSVTLGKGVTYIGSGAFINNQLTSVVIPDGVTSIGAWAFLRNQLTSVTLGKGVTYIGRWAFSGNQLTSVVIPESVTFIGSEAFAENQLTSVTIGANVTHSRAFDNGFDDFYNNNGKKAGTYTYSNRWSWWSFTPR